jgi:uncharacterized membrane protein YphA (DoxX/SURF4 family)
MSAGKPGGGADFGLLIARLALGGFIALAGLNKLAMFVEAADGPQTEAVEAVPAGTQPTEQPDTEAAPQSGDEVDTDADAEGESDEQSAEQNGEAATEPADQAGEDGDGAETSDAGEADASDRAGDSADADDSAEASGDGDAEEPTTQPAGDVEQEAEATEVGEVGEAVEGFKLPVEFQWPGFSDMLGSVQDFVNKHVIGMKPDWLPQSLASMYGYAIPFLETILGVFVIIGLLTRFSSTILLLMVGSFTYALAANSGVLLPNISGGPYHPNFVFLAVLLLFMGAGPGRASFDALFSHRKDKVYVEHEHHEHEA